MKRYILPCLLLGISIFQHAHAQTKAQVKKLENKVYSSTKKVLPIAFNCLSKAVKEVADVNRYPNYAKKNGQWKTNTSADWTSGFFPGTLWYAYELSKQDSFKQWAIQWTRGIANQKYNDKTHDLGFRFNCAFGNGLRLAANDTATANYKDILLTATQTADSRYSKILGLYPSDWDRKKLPNSVPCVVDIMMNLELFFWASQHGGDTSMVNRCISHANKTYADFVRPDFGTFHVVRYDKTNGQILNKGQLQGDVDSSTWSRGQAWMIYGYTVMYRYTHDTQYLTKACNLSNYFIQHLPASKVAYWDFQSNIKIYDASASAIVTSALFELYKYLPESKKWYYYNQALLMLQALCSKEFFSYGNNTNCLLLHSTQYYHETENTDVPSTFADYYFLEAIQRLQRIVQSHE